MPQSKGKMQRNTPAILLGRIWASECRKLRDYEESCESCKDFWRLVRGRSGSVQTEDYKVVKGLRNGVVPVDVFWVVTKISGVVDLVLKELKSQDLLVIEGTIEGRITNDACNFIVNKVPRLTSIGTLHQKILIKSPPLNRQHQVSSRFHGSIANDMTPHLERVAEKRVLAGTFLVFRICGFE